MRKGMAYGRMRQIDKMTAAQLFLLPESERELYLRTERPIGDIIKQIDETMAMLNRERAS